MKKLFITLMILSLSLCSCNEEAKRQAEEAAKKARNDSIIVRKIKEKEMEEAKLVFEDSVAIYAWGDAKFGMTKKEVLQTKAFSGASKYNNSFSMDFDKERALQQSIGLHHWPDIWIDFGGKTENEVTCVRINSSYNWKDFNKLIYDIQQIIKEFTLKYGRPDNSYEQLPNLRYRDLDNKKLLIARWQIGSGIGENGTKYIKVYASPYTETSYQYEIDIYNSSFPKQPKEKTQKEIQEAKEKEMKTKEAVENSF